MDSNNTEVAREIRIFSSLARELVSELLCQFSFVDFSFSLKFKKIQKLSKSDISFYFHSTSNSKLSFYYSHYYSLINVSFKLNLQAYQPLDHEPNTLHPIHIVYLSLACISRPLQKESFY